jgi:hypothetical protein
MDAHLARLKRAAARRDASRGRLASGTVGTETDWPWLAASLFILAVMVAFTSCASEKALAPAAYQLAGDWLFVEHIEVPSVAAVCDDTIQLHLDQVDVELFLTGYRYGLCRFPGGEVLPGLALDSIVGSIHGTEVSFEVDGCPYTGTAASDLRVEGTTACDHTALTHHSSASGTWRMVRADFNDPVASVTVGPSGVSQGESLFVAAQGRDDQALAWIGARVTGVGTWEERECWNVSFAAADSVPAQGKDSTHTFAFVVPECVGGVTAVAFARDTAGHRAESPPASLAVTLPVTALQGTADDTVYTLGDTARIDVVATNPRGLGYIGVVWSDQRTFVGRDSVAVAGDSVAHTFQILVPADLVSNFVDLTVFARHRLGFPTELALPTSRLTDAVKVPVTSVELPGRPVDAVYRRASDRLYLVIDSLAGIQVVSLNPLALDAVIPLPRPGTSLDLTPAEDTLVVTLSGTPEAEVMRIDGAAATTYPLQWSVGANFRAAWVRTVTGGRAIVGFGNGDTGVLSELWLGTGSQVIRVQWWYSYETFERSGDHRRLLVTEVLTPWGSQLYRAETDAFEPLGVEYSNPVRPDTAGRYWIVGGELFTADLVWLQRYSDPSLHGDCALAPDASSVYCGRYDGFVQFDAMTGARVRAVHLPEPEDRLWALPGGRVVALRDHRLHMVTVP